MHDAHQVDDLLLDLGRAHNVELGQEVVSHSNERVFRPALEPVHRAARYQSGELETALTEFLSNLKWKHTQSCLRLYGVGHMVKDHSDSEKGNLLLPHRLLLSINSKGSFICTIPQTG